MTILHMLNPCFTCYVTGSTGFGNMLHGLKVLTGYIAGDNIGYWCLEHGRNYMFLMTGSTGYGQQVTQVTHHVTCITWM